jgi:hypothetical protein
MNQSIKKLEDLTIVYTWLDDNKVYVKYFIGNREIDSFIELTEYQSDFIFTDNKNFCKENPELILYSY